jgi:hypothetical protein
MALKFIGYILGLQTVLSLGGYVGYLFIASKFFGGDSIDPARHGLGLALGSFVSGMNFLALSIFYLYVFHKKRVALGITTVVFKYAILGILLWYFLIEKMLPQGAFLVGVVLNPVAVIFYALLNSRSLLGGSGDSH